MSCVNPYTSVSPVVNISCPDEEEVEIENNEEKKEDFEPSQNGNEEPSTSQKKNNQEVRSMRFYFQL